jgi:predicted ATP-grasp superfamily ATP-dependent carboligase
VHGSQDVIIEVNPRLTTSYVGLRTACRGNLGELMLRKALGEEVTVDFRCERIEFEACGKVRMSGASSALTGDHSR